MRRAAGISKSSDGACPACPNTVFCSPGAHFDTSACTCVPSCVDNALCIQGSHFDGVTCYLHLLGRLDLLRQLFGCVLVPEQVAGELARGRELGHDLPDPGAVTWLEVCAVEPADHGALDLGETAALTLAASVPGAIVVLDDLAARSRATELGLPLTGTVGLLVEAKGRGLIPAIAPALDLPERSGFRLSAGLVLGRDSLRRVGDRALGETRIDLVHVINSVYVWCDLSNRASGLRAEPRAAPAAARIRSGRWRASAPGAPWTSRRRPCQGGAGHSRRLVAGPPGRPSRWTRSDHALCRRRSGRAPRRARLRRQRGRGSPGGGGRRDGRDLRRHRAFVPRCSPTTCRGGGSSADSTTLAGSPVRRRSGQPTSSRTGSVGTQRRCATA